MTGPDDGERRPPSRAWPLVLGLVAALPAVLAGWRVVRWGWVPVGDHGIIATRAYDVLSSRSPQLGQASTVTGDGPLARSPGPMGYWVIALPSRVGPLWAPAVTAAALAVASVVGSVALAWRRAGPAFAAAVALGLVLVARAIDPLNLAAIWNPSLGLAPMVLLFFLGWSVGVGERRLFPLLALIGSLLGQVHLGVAVPAAGVVALATVAGFANPALGWIRARRRSVGRAPEQGARDGRWFLAGAAVFVVCWALPAFQQLTHRPGNLQVLLRSSGGTTSTMGWGDAARFVADAVGVVPRFLGRVQTPIEVVAGIPGWASATVVSAAVLPLEAAVLAGLAARRGDRSTPVAVGLLAAMALGAWVAAAQTPDDLRILTISYSLRWLVAWGLLVWLVAAWALAGVVSPASPLRRGRAGAVGASATAGASGRVAGPGEPEVPTLRAEADVLAAGPGRSEVVATGTRLAGPGDGSEATMATAPTRGNGLGGGLGRPDGNGGRSGGGWRDGGLPSWVASVGLALVAVVGVAVAVATPTDDFEQSLYRPFDRMGDAVVAEVEPGRRYLIDAVGLLEGEVAPAMTYRIRRAGASPVLAGAVGEATGSAYRPTGVRCAAVFTFLPGRAGAPVPPGGEVLVAVSTPVDSAIQVDGVTAVVRPDDGPPSC